MDEFDKKIYLLLRKRLRDPIENSWKLNPVKKNNSSNETTRGFSNYTVRDLNPFLNDNFSQLNHNCIKLLSKRKK